MKSAKLALIITAFGATLLLVASTPAPQTAQRKPISSKHVLLNQTKSDITCKPKAPSRQRISCQYDGENLVFDFVYSEGTCTADLTEMATGYTQIYTFDSDDLTAEIYVGQLYESTITLTTEAGNTYTADLTAE